MSQTNQTGERAKFFVSGCHVVWNGRVTITLFGGAVPRRDRFFAKPRNLRHFAA